MKAILVGSGNVGTHLAFALKAAGIEVVQIWSKQAENAKKWRIDNPEKVVECRSVVKVYIPAPMHIHGGDIHHFIK